MILLDKNNKPNNTVYYISSVVYGLIKKNNGIDYVKLYKKLNSIEKNEVNINFYSLSLDFLFLIDKISLDKKGGLHVSQIS